MSRQSWAMPITRAALRGTRAGSVSPSRRRGRRATGSPARRAAVVDRRCYLALSSTVALAPSGVPTPSSDERRGRRRRTRRPHRARRPTTLPPTTAPAPERSPRRRIGAAEGPLVERRRGPSRTANSGTSAHRPRRAPDLHPTLRDRAASACGRRAHAAAEALPAAPRRPRSTGSGSASPPTPTGASVSNS